MKNVLFSAGLNSTNLSKFFLPHKILIFKYFIPVFFIVFAGLPDSSLSQTPLSLPIRNIERMGPGGGGGIVKVVVNPENSDQVVAHSDMTGGYVSYDSGRNWTMFNLWAAPTDFQFIPNSNGSLFASSRGYLYGNDRGAGISALYRSDDQGLTWRVIFPKTPVGSDWRTLQSDKRLPSEKIKNSIDGSIDKIAINQSNPQNIVLGCSPLREYIGSSFSNKRAVTCFAMTSEDGGNSWESPIYLGGKHIFALAHCPEKDYWVAITDLECVHFNQTEIVQRWPLPTKKILQATVAGQNGRTIFLLTPFERSRSGFKGGLFESKDGGKTWRQKNGNLIQYNQNNLKGPDVDALGVCIGNPSVLYIAVTMYESRGKFQNKRLYSIYKSSDGGDSWEASLVVHDDGTTFGSYTGGWLDDDYPPGWFGSPKHLSVSRSNPDICYATDNGRVFRTLDGGKQWHQVYTRKLEGGYFSSTGLDVTTTYGVHFDPFNPEAFFVSYTDVGLFKSLDNGRSWRHSIKGIPLQWRNTCYWAAFDPDVPDKVWSAWGRVHDLPRAKMFRSSAGFDWASGGVAVSHDGGKQWNTADNGLPNKSICTHILVDKSSNILKRCLYTCVFGKGVYKSINGGRSWESASNGLGENRFVWKMEQATNGWLYLIVVKGVKRKKTLPGKLYCSQNQGISWDPIPLPDGVDAPADLFIDPSNPNGLLIGCWPKTINDRDRFGGVHLTTSGGKKWKQIFDERYRVNGVAVDPHDKRRMVINTFHNGAFISNNSGRSWDLLDGYDFKWGQKVFFHPLRSNQLYLTTFGASFFWIELPKMP